MNETKNMKILKIGILVIILAFAANAFYYMQLKIDEPVFLKHYYELYIQNGTLFDIHYISHSTDDRKIIRIEFPQMPEEFAYLSNGGYIEGFGRNERVEYAHFQYNTVMGTIYYDSETENEKHEFVVLDKAIITYNNGDVQEVDIGKIILHKNYYYSDLIDTSYNSSSNDFTSTTEIRPTKNIVIESISSGLDDETNGILLQTLNGIDFKSLNFPINAKNGEDIRIESKFLYNTDNTRKYNVYEVQQIINVVDKEGNKGSHRIVNINYYPIEVFLKERGIIEYLKVRGALR